MIRRLRPVDIPALREIHARSGYGFEFPAIYNMPVGFVLEEDSRPAVWVGAELEAQVYMVADPDWGSPHERMRTFASLHLPVAKALDRLKVKTANVALDPKFKSFGRRLSQLGWKQALWDHYFMSVDECINALTRRAG